MARIKFLTSRLERFKQPDVEEDPNSLTSQAFRQRLLDQNTEVPLATLTAPQSRVAVYRPRPNSFLRLLLKILLVGVLPILAIVLIVWITVSIVGQNQTALSQPANQAETIFDNGIPIPAGVRVISRSTTDASGMKTIAIGAFKNFLPSYNPLISKLGSYISPHNPPPTIPADATVSTAVAVPQSVQDLANYYRTYLTTKSKPAWQVYGNMAKFGDQYTTMYVRAINGQQILGGLLVQLEPVDSTVMGQSPGYYDSQAKVGDVVILLSEAQLNR